MSPEQQALAQRLVRCEQWRWMPGMLAENGSRYLGDEPAEAGGPQAWADPVNEGAAVRYLWPDHLVGLFAPDLADHATAAILLRMAMDANLGTSSLDSAWAIYGAANIRDIDLGTRAAIALIDFWGQP